MSAGGWAVLATFVAAIFASELAFASIIAKFSSTLVPMRLSGFFELHALRSAATAATTHVTDLTLIRMVGNTCWQCRTSTVA